MEITCLGFLVFFSCEVPERAPADSYCQVARPVYWHASDSRKTKEQVDRENRKYKRLCGTAK